MTSQNSIITEQSNDNSSCCKNINPCPYTYSEKVYDLCCIGCDKPGIGHSSHNPGDNSCEDCAIFCLPFTIVVDILCYVPLCLGYIKVEK